jgi:ATP-binding cassette subfamily B protein
MLTRLMTYRPLLLVASLVTWTVAFCLPIVTGLANKAIFDHLHERSSFDGRLWALFGVLVAVAIVGPLLMLLWFWTHTTFETMVEALVRLNLYEWILSTVGRRRAQPSAPHLLGNLRDDVPGHTDLVNEWYRMVGEGVFVVVALVIMVRIDPLVTALTFLPLAAVVLLTHWMRTRLPRLWGEARDATTAVTDLVGDVFGGVQAVKAAGAERAVLGRFRQVNDVRRRAEVRSQVAMTRIDALTAGIVVSGRGLVLLVAAGAMLDGRFSVGDFMLFITYLDWMLMLPRRMGRLLSQRKASVKALERLGDTMGDTPLRTLVRHRPVHIYGSLPEVPVPRRTAADRLEELTVTGLTYRYPGSEQGIADVDLRLRRGTVTVVTGEIGSGKSTLLEVLLGLRQADGGELRWNGEPVPDPAAVMVPPRVAYKPQVPRLFSESLRDTILLGMPDTELDRALHRAVFTEDVTGLPDGLDTMVGSRGVRLSGGQAQRASAARMFVRGPELHVVDDLSSALDEETERTLWERLDAARERDGATYLMVSHRPAALRRADTVVVLAGGRVEAAGPPDEVADASPFVRRVLAHAVS